MVVVLDSLRLCLVLSLLVYLERSPRYHSCVNVVLTSDMFYFLYLDRLID